LRARSASSRSFSESVPDGARVTARASSTFFCRTVTTVPMLTPALARVSASILIVPVGVSAPAGHTFATVVCSPSMSTVSPLSTPRRLRAGSGTRATPRPASRFSAPLTVSSIRSSLM
jgi:hypothetical protein